MSNALTVIDDEAGMLGAMTQQNQATISTAIQIAAAMTDKRISTARAFPRSVARFKKEASQLLREDVETARQAEYAKPVGGGTVKGPSVRLAEIAAMCWGNLEVTAEEPIVGDKSVSVKAAAWDLERNYRQESIVTTAIVGKNGQRYPGHLIETAGLATQSKAKRNAIMAVIPRAYIQDLLEVARQVARGNEKPLEQRRADMVGYFARTHKVTAEQIVAMLGIAGIDDMNEDQLYELHTVATSLKEGHAKPEEFFETKAESKVEAIKAKVNERKTKANGGAAPPLPGKDLAPVKKPTEAETLQADIDRAEAQAKDGKLFGSDGSPVH